MTVFKGEDMLVKDIILKALIRLGAEDDYDLQQLGEINDKRLSDLIFSLNTVVKEITTDYLPLRAIDTLKVDGGAINYSAFANHVVNVRRVKRKSEYLTFKAGIESVKVFCADGDVECEYDYSLGDLTMASEFFLSRRISDELVVFGLIGDYCLTKGMLDSSLTYDRRYRDALNLAMRDTAERRIVGRGWYD